MYFIQHRLKLIYNLEALFFCLFVFLCVCFTLCFNVLRLVWKCFARDARCYHAVAWEWMTPLFLFLRKCGTCLIAWEQTLLRDTYCYLLFKTAEYWKNAVIVKSLLYRAWYNNCPLVWKAMPEICARKGILIHNATLKWPISLFSFLEKGELDHMIICFVFITFHINILPSNH